MVYVWIDCSYCQISEITIRVSITQIVLNYFFKFLYNIVSLTTLHTFLESKEFPIEISLHTQNGAVLNDFYS